MTRFAQRHWWGVAALAVVAAASGLVPGTGDWLQLQRPLELSILMTLAVAAAVCPSAYSFATATAVMPLSFLVDLASLLLLGPTAAMMVAATGVLAEWLAYPRRAHRRRRLAVSGAVAVAGIQAAAYVHQSLGGTLRHFDWPWHVLPLAAAVVTYVAVRSVCGEVIAPLLGREPVDRTWTDRAILGGATYLMGATAVVVVLELIDGAMWHLLLAGAVPLAVGYTAYRDYVGRWEDDHHRARAADLMGEGVTVLDGEGRVTLWTEALTPLLGCPRKRALGHALIAAVPTLDTTELRRAIESASAEGQASTVVIDVASASRSRTLQVRILPHVDGVTLVWRDVTERAQAERDARRAADRLALAADGANDGLWEWDLRTDETYFSPRWRAMIGVPDEAANRPETWLDRIHPDDLAPFQEALKAHLSGQYGHLRHEHRIRHEDGTYRWYICRGTAARAGRRPIRMAGSLTELQELPSAEGKRVVETYVDPLTGLCNRAEFVEVLGRRLDKQKQQVGGDRYAVLYLDVDRFKIVNDSLGHPVGDELLVAVSRRLETCLRPRDTLARLGGDEFAILLDGLLDEQQANAVAFRIQSAVSTPFSIGGREVFTSVSIGIAPGLSKYTTPDEIMRDADTAMYHAKRRGKARHEMFDAAMDARVQDRLSLENDLRHAIDSNEFEVQYQPIVLLATRMCIGFESLVRWTRNGEAVSPATFVPIAEELGLIEPLGTWVLHHACQQFADWKRRFPEAGLECITVNASSRQLMQQNFVNVVDRAVREAGLQPGEVRIEITETALMDSPGEAADVLQQLRDFGVKVYLDDFGTGYSSLSHLHKLPVDALKIDRTFVRSLLQPDRPAIVESILALARTLKTSVVAEGIESESQARELERLGCTHAQGYFFSKPMPASGVQALLAARQPLGPTTTEPDENEIYYPTGPFTWDVPRKEEPAGTLR